MSCAPLTVWITRAEPGAAATAARVAGLGHRPLVEPLLQIEPLTEVTIDLEGVAALAFTSGNGVRAFAELNPRRDIRVFAVGAGTTAAAKAAGFRSVLSAEGDVNALAGRIAARRGELRGAVLHACAMEPAGDLVGALTEAGLEARGQALYSSVAATPSKGFLKGLDDVDAILLHSPRAAAVLARILETHPLENARILCLSPAVAGPLASAKVREVVCAPFPIEAALLNLVGRGAPNGTAPLAATGRLKSL